MTLSQFLEKLDWALERARTDPGLLSVERGAADRISGPGEILIGTGNWTVLQEDTCVSIAHSGICLNDKGVERRFPDARPYFSLTGLVLRPPAALADEWAARIGGRADPAEVLRAWRLFVEDVGPDSCFGFLCWLARVAGVDPEAFQAPPYDRWVRAAEAWERTGMVDDPERSWPTLQAALGHGFLQQDLTCPSTHGAIALRNVWLDGLRFVTGLLRRGVDPFAVPEIGDFDLYRRARALLDFERQDYRQSLADGTRLQLVVPLAGTADSRRLMVDAVFLTEILPGGSKKVFIRTDRENSYLKQGFAVMGLFRPGGDMRGTGYDMTVSVNPDTGIHLKDLWEELERLEDERWGSERPRDKPRDIPSYRGGARPPNQPWGDGRGSHGILGAPYSVAPGVPGSRLEWHDVVDAAWRCYNPIRGISIEDINADNALTPLLACRVLTVGVSAKRLAAVRWPSKATAQPLHMMCPTTERLLAALLLREEGNRPIGVDDLPPAEQIDAVMLRGGYAILHERGVFLVDDWRSETLAYAELRGEFERAVSWCDAVTAFGQTIDRLAGDLKGKAERANREGERIRLELAGMRAEIARMEAESGTKSTRSYVRAFRERLEQIWGIGGAVHVLRHRIAELEDALKTASALRAEGVLRILSFVGVPFIVGGHLISFTGPFWDRAADALGLAQPAGGSLIRVVSYFCLATVLYLVFRWAGHSTRPHPHGARRSSGS